MIPNQSAQTPKPAPIVVGRNGNQLPKPKQIVLTEEDANEALARHGCIVAELGDRGISRIHARGLQEHEAIRWASTAAALGKQIGVFKLSRIITREKIE